MMRLRDGRVIARAAADFRLAAASILAQGQHRGLVAFRLVDTHLHALLVGPRANVGAFARYAAGSIARRLALGVAFGPAHVEEVRSQAHLVNTFHYVLRQERRHDVRLDPMHDGSALPDLLGMRVVAPWLADRVKAHLPRLRRSDLEAHGLAVQGDEAAVDLAHLADAAAAAFALRAVDGGRVPRVVEARRAAVHAAPAGALAPIADALSVSRSAVCRLRGADARFEHVRAVRLQLRARTAWASAASIEPCVLEHEQAHPPRREHLLGRVHDRHLP